MTYEIKRRDNGNYDLIVDGVIYDSYPDIQKAAEIIETLNKIDERGPADAIS